MKKTILSLVVVVVFGIVINSCSNEEVVPNQLFENSTDLLNAVRGTPSQAPGGIMVAGLVDEGACSVSGRLYSVYATNYPAVNFDRTVNVSIFKQTASGTFYEVDGGNVVIKANQTSSNNLLVFGGATEVYGQVTVQVLSVSGPSGDISNLYDLRSIGQPANNCALPTNPGYEDDFCNGDDHDNDGLCDCLDSDYTGDRSDCFKVGESDNGN